MLVFFKDNQPQSQSQICPFLSPAYEFGGELAEYTSGPRSSSLAVAMGERGGRGGAVVG